jgi:hypothetical protein
MRSCGQISGLIVRYNVSLPVGQRITSVTLSNGTPVPDSDSASYSLATINFVTSGGDGYTMLRGGADLVSRDLDADLFQTCVAARPTLTPVKDGRILGTQ